MNLAIRRNEKTNRVISLKLKPTGAVDEIFLTWLTNKLTNVEPIDMGDGKVFISGANDVENPNDDTNSDS